MAPYPPCGKKKMEFRFWIFPPNHFENKKQCLAQIANVEGYGSVVGGLCTFSFHIKQMTIRVQIFLLIFFLFLKFISSFGFFLKLKGFPFPPVLYLSWSNLFVYLLEQCPPLLLQSHNATPIIHLSCLYLFVNLEK